MKKLLLTGLLATLLACFLITWMFMRVICSVSTAADIINLDSGPISGTASKGLRVYLGIPYAAPPVGELRWKVTQPVKPWTEVKTCVAFGPSCPQPESEKVGITSEDCLYLNVWTPAKTAGDKLPVMVWIHGGGWSLGSASMPQYDGAKLAKKGVVFVSFNYRLGPFGFLVHPGLAKELLQNVSGNYGFLDQIAALKWVKKNIAAFGGDPDNITIFGESAGAMAVSLHMISPLSTGLFNRGICQSGGPFGEGYIVPRTDCQLQKALAEGEKLAVALNCDKAPDPIAAMRAKSADEILKAYTFALSEFSPGMIFAPVIDGYVIPDDPAKMFMQEKNLDIPMIIGSNADEGNAFYQPMTVAEYKNWIGLQFGKHADAVFAMFPANADADVRSAFDRFSSVMIFAEPARFVARCREGRTTKTYLYHFTRVAPTELGKTMGAAHGAEVPYVLGNINKKAGFAGTDLKISKEMLNFWVNFAKKGDPNEEKVTVWPVYNAKSDENIEFGDKINVNKNLLKKECDFIRYLQQ